jgi:hypothetical protein
MDFRTPRDPKHRINYKSNYLQNAYFSSYILLGIGHIHDIELKDITQVKINPKK